MSPGNRRIYGPVAALAAVFVIKLVVLVQLKDHPLTQPDVGLDTSAYASLARQVVSGDLWLGPDTYFVSPLYIYFVAAGLALADSFTLVRLLQIALGTMAVGFIFLTAQLWFGRRAAWIATALAGLTGLFTFYEVLILQASLDVFLTSAALLALAVGLRSERARWFLIAGIVFGLATLNRPNMLAGAAAVAIAALAARRVKPALLIGAGLLIGIAPVALRNALVTKEFSLVSSHGGLNFFIGNGEGATGFYRQIPGISPTIAGQARDARQLVSQKLGRPATAAEASDYFFDLGLQRLRAYPGEAISLFTKKLYFVFHGQHIALPYSFPFYAYDANTALQLYAVGPWLIIPLGLVGLVAGLRRPALPPSRKASADHRSLGAGGQGRRNFLIWLSFIPGYAAGVAMFFVAERYRLPILVPLIVTAAGAIDAAMRAVSARRYGAIALPAAAFVALVVILNWSHGLNDGRWQEGVRMAERLAIIGQPDEADAWVKRLEPDEPRPGAARFAVGLQWLTLGQAARAVPYLTEAAARDPQRPEIAQALGQALLRTDRPREALPHLARAFDAGVAIELPGYDLAVALRDTGDLARAAEVARRIAPPEDAGAEVWLRAGRLASQLRALDTADRFFQRGAALAPRDAAARQQYGLNLLLLMRYEDAARELGEAVRLNPRDADSLAHLAYAQAKTGRGDDARAHAAAALAVQPGHTLAQQVLAALGGR